MSAEWAKISLAVGAVLLLIDGLVGLFTGRLYLLKADRSINPRLFWTYEIVAACSAALFGSIAASLQNT